jgi:hypothetical protein
MTSDYDRSLTRMADVDDTVHVLENASGSSGSAPDDDAMGKAAEALRQAEVEAVLPDLNSLEPSQLEHMSIDELRAVAKALDVPGRAQITEQDELIEAIRRCL